MMNGHCSAGFKPTFSWQPVSSSLDSVFFDINNLHSKVKIDFTLHCNFSFYLQWPNKMKNVGPVFFL